MSKPGSRKAQAGDAESDVGNASFGDDGFGLEVLRQLERERWERPHGF